MPVTLRRGDPDRKQRDRFEGGLPKSKRGAAYATFDAIFLRFSISMSADRLVFLEYGVHRVAYFCFADFIAKPLQFEIALCDDGVRKLPCIFRLRRSLAFHDNPPA